MNYWELLFGGHMEIQHTETEIQPLENNPSDSQKKVSYESQMAYWMTFALTQVMPKINQITQQEDCGFHGLNHTEEVMWWGIDYALSENTNPIPVIIACGLHDCARTHDGDDKLHAREAVPIAKRFLEKYDFGLSETEKESIIEAVKEHTDGQRTTDKIAACLWDADRTRLAWEYGFVLSEKISTSRGLDVAKLTGEQRAAYQKTRKEILQSIGAPSYILMEENLPQNDYGCKIYDHKKEIQAVGTEDNPIIAYHGTHYDIAQFKLISAHGHGAFFSPRIRYACNYCTKINLDNKKDVIIYVSNSAGINASLYSEYLQEKYGFDVERVFSILIAHIQKNNLHEKILLTEENLKEIFEKMRLTVNDDTMKIICDHFRNKPIEVSEVPTRERPWIYQVELRGIFPNPKKTFKDQKINLPLDRICRFMGIDYPITQAKDFLQQTFEKISKASGYASQKSLIIDLEKKYRHKLSEIEILNQQIIQTEKRMDTIDSILNPPPEKKTTFLGRIGRLFRPTKKLSPAEKQALEEEKRNLKEHKEQLISKKDNAVQEEIAYTEEQTRRKLLLQHKYADLIKLDEFCENISNNESDLSEEMIASYVQYTQNILQNFIHNQAMKSWKTEDIMHAYTIGLVDGVQNPGGEDGTLNYFVTNLNAIKLGYRYTYSRNNVSITKIERPNSLGHYAPEPERNTSSKPDQLPIGLQIQQSQGL